MVDACLAGDTAAISKIAQKAEERLRKMVGNVKILVIASHRPQIIEATCNRVVKLDHGQFIDPS